MNNRLFIIMIMLFSLKDIIGQVGVVQQIEISAIEKELFSDIRKLINNGELSDSIQFIYWRNDSLPVIQKINSFVGVVYKEYNIQNPEMEGNYVGVTVYQSDDLVQIIDYLNEIVVDSSLNNRSLKYKASFSKMYYFVVQIHSVKSDTITYEVIEIYCRTPTFKISNVERKDAKVEIVKLPLSNFNKGYLNGAKKKQVGSVMVLYTLDTWIGNDNFVKFDNIKKKDNTFFLSEMHRLGE